LAVRIDVISRCFLTKLSTLAFRSDNDKQLIRVLFELVIQDGLSLRANI